DVYSAGATLFFALAARPPYGGEGSSVMMQVINADPPALPSPLDGGPLAAVVRRAMEKKREARYATAAELAQAIRQANEAEMSSRAPRRFPPLRLALAIGIPVLALALGATVMGTRGSSPVEAAPPRPPTESRRPAAPVSVAPVRPPEPAAPAPAPAPAVPPESVPGLAEARRLAAAGRRDSALAALARLRKQYPDSADVPYLEGQVDFRNLRWVDGLAAYRAAIGLAPTLRSDPALIRDVIQCLGSDRFHRTCEDFLRKEIGAPAVPHLTEAAGTHQYANVRTRARRLAAEIDRNAR
ncbi:MAG TPA: hypothetical protein VFB81_18665, partial [Myxococcales bacterium]|nr:hypothetical protein [Myxococcales bacterium]